MNDIDFDGFVHDLDQKLAFEIKAFHTFDHFSINVQFVYVLMYMKVHWSNYVLVSDLAWKDTEHISEPYFIFYTGKVFIYSSITGDLWIVSVEYFNE